MPSIVSSVTSKRQQKLAMLYVSMDISKKTTQPNPPTAYHCISEVPTVEVYGNENTRRQERVVNQTQNSKRNSLKDVKIQKTVRVHPPKRAAAGGSFRNENVTQRWTYCTPRNAVSELLLNAVFLSRNAFHVLSVFAKRTSATLFCGTGRRYLRNVVAELRVMCPSSRSTLLCTFFCGATYHVPYFAELHVMCPFLRTCLSYAFFCGARVFQRMPSKEVPPKGDKRKIIVHLNSMEKSPRWKNLNPNNNHQGSKKSTAALESRRL